MDFSGTLVLVAGGRGFLGRHLLAKLSYSGATLHAISRREPVECSCVQWWQGDVRNLEWLRHLVSRIKPDVLYQLTSASQGGKEPGFVAETFENDLRTTVNLLSTAREVGCNRIIITGSLEEPCGPGYMLTPSSPYAASKAASVLYGKMFHQLYGVPVVILRPFMTYGPGQKDYKLIPYIINCLLRNKAPSVSSGNRPVDWVYVDDVIEAFVAAARTPEAIGQEIDLGSGVLVTIREVVDQIRRLVPGSPGPEFRAMSDRINEQVRTAETATARRVLAWSSSTSLPSGLSRTIDWYRKLLSDAAKV